MNLPPVKFSIMADIKPATDALKSITSATNKFYQQRQNLAQDSAKRIERIEQDLARKIERIQEDNYKDVFKGIEKVSRAHQDAARKRIRLEEDTAIRISRIGQNNGNGSGPSGKFGGMRGIRGAAMMLGAMQLPLGNVIRSGLGGAMMGSEAGPVGMAGGFAIAASVAAITDALSAGATMVERGIGIFVSAITQIGGWKGVVGGMVERENANQEMQRLSALQGIPKSEQMSKFEQENRMTSVKKGSPFSREDIQGGITEYQKLTGNLRSGYDIAPDVLKLAKVNNISAEKMFNVAGTLQAQHPNLDNSQLIQLLRNINRLGEAGSTPLSDANSIGRATAYGNQLAGGNTVKGVGIEYGLVQSARKGGAPNPAVSVGRLQDYMEKNMPGETSVNPTTGQHEFHNFGKSLANLYEKTSGGTHVLPGMERSKMVLSGIREEVMAENPNATMKQQKEAVEKLVESWGNLNVTSKELNEEYNKTTDNVKDKLTIAFNDLYDQLNSVLLPTLENDVIPAFNKFVKTLSDPKVHEELMLIKGDISQFSAALINILPTAAFLSDVFLKTAAAALIIPQKWFEVLGLILDKFHLGNTEVGKAVHAVSDSLYQSEKGLSDSGAALRRIAHDLTNINFGNDKSLEPSEVSTPHFIRGNVKTNVTNSSPNDFNKFQRAIHGQTEEQKRHNKEMVGIIKQMVPNHPNRSGLPNGRGT